MTRFARLQTTALPNFMIVGVPKAGTTALYANLAEHPEIFMSPVKEPNYFIAHPRRDGTVMSWPEYQALFEGSRDEPRIGEASPGYLHSREAAERIHEMNPETRIVVCLRQPVERAYSHHLMMLNAGIELEDFPSLFRRGVGQVRRGEAAPYGSGLRQSFYSEGLEAYQQVFGREAVHVTIYEDYRQHPAEELEKVFRFLGVDPTYQPTSMGRSVNQGFGAPRREALRKLVFDDNPVKRIARRLVPESLRRRGVRRLVRANQTRKPTLDNNLKTEFNKVFVDDVAKLNRLVGRDLTSLWELDRHVDDR